MGDVDVDGRRLGVRGRDLVGVLVIAVGMALVLWFQPTDETASRNLTDWEVVALLGIVLLAVLGLAGIEIRQGPVGRYRATLAGTLWWLPWLAALLTSVLFLASVQGRSFWHDNALLLGTWAALVLWLVYPFVDRDYATAAQQSPGWTGLLRDRIAELGRMIHDARSDACTQAEAAAAYAHAGLRLADLRGRLGEPGLGWVTRDGFNAAWTEAHGVEESLIAVMPAAGVVELALADTLRLRGSKLAERDDLEAKIKIAMLELDPKVEPYFTKTAANAEAATTSAATAPATATATAATAAASSPGVGVVLVVGVGLLAGGAALLRRALRWNEPSTGSKEPSTQVEAAKAPAAPDCTAARRARTAFVTHHRALNAYRGGLWADLGRARWLLVRTTAVAGLVSFLFLALAILGGVGASQIETAWAYFLTGGIAGLFLRLRDAGTETNVRDDYGLDAARLYQTPLLSGIAAIVGVTVLALVTGSTLGDILKPVVPAAEPGASPAASIAPGVASLAVLAADDAEAASGDAQAETPAQSLDATLETAFTLSEYPIGLVVAFAFGLTPGLVLTRFGLSLTGTKDALVASQATGQPKAAVV